MLKSTIKLANGTIITIEGSAEEVSKLVALYGMPNNHDAASIGESNEVLASAKKTEDVEKMDTISLVNATKDAEDYEQIEKNILDKASQVDRVMLPIFLAKREFGNNAFLTSNDIYKYLKEFGISMALPNISKTLSGSAKNYVMSNSVRKKGASTSYRISRKGEQYLEQILSK